MAYCSYIAVVFSVLFCKASSTSCKNSPIVRYSASGSTVNLTCNLNVQRMYVTWLGPPNFTLYAIGKDVVQTKQSIIKMTGNEQINQHILQVISMQYVDEGVYKCTAKGKEECHELLIQKPPRNIKVIGSDTKSVLFGVINQQMNLTCDVESGQPPETMHWEYDHNVIAHGGPGSLSYTFIPNSTQHLKSFMCRAFTNQTNTLLTKTVKLYLYSEPTTQIFPRGAVNITEDDDLLLECTYTSNDNNNTNITWKYTSNGRIKQIDTKVLKVENIKRTDKGNYTCLVSNTAGTAQDTVTVNVQYSPAINITFHDQLSSRNMNCNVNGNPAEYVFSAWEHLTDCGDHIRFLNDSGSGYIELKNASGETDKHHDQGIYICSVSNGVSYGGNIKQFANYTLKQEGLPYFPSVNDKIQYGMVGKEANLTFNVVSYPTIRSVAVYTNHSEKINDVNYTTEKSTLRDKVYGTYVRIKGYKLFLPIKINVRDNFMIYTVVVTNRKGPCNISVDLRSASAPMKPTKVVPIPGPNTITLTWQRGFDGGSVQSFVVEYSKSGSDSWKDEKVGTLNVAVIDGLESETEFILRVYSQNDLGRSNSSDEIFVKTGKQVEESSSYTAIVVTIPLLIIISLVSGTLVYYYLKKGNLVRKDDLGCMQWTKRRNAVGVQGMENGVYDMQNNLAPDHAAQSNDPPVYSSIDRKHKLSIGQAVSYSVTKKVKKPNPLIGRKRRRNKGEHQIETDADMSTSQAEDNYQLNYVDVCFDPKPAGHHFEIHGMDKKSEYVDIDFSKSIKILPDSEKLDGSDEDFSSVADVIAMKRDMMI